MDNTVPSSDGHPLLAKALVDRRADEVDMEKHLNDTLENQPQCHTPLKASKVKVPSTMASNLDDLVYLQPNFDLWLLTVPRLRGILVEYEISYPDSAKKAQLIDILKENLLPQANKLLDARQLVQRTSEGIVYMNRDY
jgi:hypothetical protein